LDKPKSARKGQAGGATAAAALAHDLSPKQRHFVEEYQRHSNGTRAAIAAGYSERSAASTASTLMRNPKVRAALGLALAKRSRRLNISAARIKQELARIAFFDMAEVVGPAGEVLSLHEMPRHARRALSGIDVDEIEQDGVTLGVVKKVRSWDKLKALELLGKTERLFVDKHEVTGEGGGALVVEVREYRDGEGE
jgi:phage terminase small subunit